MNVVGKDVNIAKEMYAEKLLSYIQVFKNMYTIRFIDKDSILMDPFR